MSAERHKTGAAGESTVDISGTPRALSRRARPAFARRGQGAICRGRRRFRPLSRRSLGRSRICARSRQRGDRSSSSSAAASAACSVARVCARPASRISASWKRPPISAAPGTGIVIPVRPAIPRATSICRCWKRPATCRCANMRARRRSTNIPAASAVTSVSTSARCFRRSSRGWRGRRQEGRWLVETDRGDRIRARFVILAGGPLSRPKLPGIPGIETLQGTQLPHQPLGLWLHRRHGRRRSHRSRRQARRHHRHRRHRRAMRAASRPIGERALCLPAHAIGDRRARRPADGSSWAQSLEARLAARADGQFHCGDLRRAVRAGSGAGRLDRPARRDPAGAASSAAAGDLDGRGAEGDRAGRLSQDGRDPRARRRRA